MSHNGGYRFRDHLLIDDVTGFVIRRSDAVVQYDGLVVHRSNADYRHPQENRPPPRVQKVPKLVRPEPADTFLEPNDVQASDFGSVYVDPNPCNN